MEDTLPVRVRLGDFEVDLRSGEMWNGGRVIRLQEKPLRILQILIEQAGELVPRAEIQRKLWPNHTVVDFEHGINTAIKLLRRALADSALEPKYIETVFGRGYRLLVPVKTVSANDASGDSAENPCNIETVPTRGYRLMVPVERASAGRSSGETVRPVAVPAAPPQLETSLIDKKVSHYRVLEVIGGGGMGLVYRAEDLKLGRQVALKFLPEELAWDSVALQRFEREAQTASSLDHPNICTIHEVEEHENQPFIVMQLLRGETLRDRLASLAAEKKTLPLKELLDIAIQISSGLEAAHAKGIIHRDIKPANIFLTSGGQVKVLDFGLAKAVSNAHEAESDGLQLPIAGRAAAPQPIRSSQPDATLTRLGVAHGTAGYMSPEQVRGDMLDARTDIFSFGLVLYEMATGHRAFGGTTAAGVHDAILNTAPVLVSNLNDNLPPKLVMIIDSALEKERDRRYQTAVEMRASLEALKEAMAPVASSSRPVKKLALTGVLTFVVVTMAAGIWWRRRPLAQLAFQTYQIEAVTSAGNVQFADISPDGRYLAYTDEESTKESLWVQQVNTRNTVRVVGPTSQALAGVRFTPDSKALYYIEEIEEEDHEEEDHFGIYRVPLMGGSPEKLVRNVEYYGEVELSPDGQHILFSRSLGADKHYIFTAKSDGSDEKRIFASKDLIAKTAWAPDGQTIAFATDHAGTGLFDGLTVLSKDGEARDLLRHTLLIHGLTWLPDQSGLIVVGRPFDQENSALWVLSYPEGRLRRLSNDLADYRGVSLGRMGDRLVTVQKQMDCWLWIAPAGNPSQASPLREGAGKKDGIRGVAWLPDGRLVYGNGDVKSELWLVDRDGTHRRQLTHTNNRASFPTANPAGTEIAFAREDPKTNIWNIWITDSSGSTMRQATSLSSSAWKPEISPDGKWMTYFTIEGVWKMPLGAGKPIHVEQSSDYATISPDGRWIAFPTWDANEKAGKLKIVAADNKEPPRFLPFMNEWQVPISTDILWPAIRWTADGKFITYVRTRNGVSNIWAQPTDGGPAQQLTNFTSMIIWSHDWSRDGKYLVMARGNFSRDAVMLTDIR
jgi:serine/threonine protein kinase/Tol biopolymer transport system component